jgi:hypothetical protein
MRVNSTNIQDEELRIGGIRHRMNSKVNQSNKVYTESKLGGNLACFQSSPHRPLLAHIYRWPSLKEREGSDMYYNISIRHELVSRLGLHLGLA